MIQALWSATSGMLGQQVAIDNTANNIANINTNGYKKSRTEFQDLLYSEMRTPNKTSLGGQTIQTGYQIGNGVRTASTEVMFAPGSTMETGNPLDFALTGNGFFTIEQPNGTVAYTKDGAFKLNANGELVNSEGYYVLDSQGKHMTFDNPQSINIDDSGAMTEIQQVGKLTGYTFTNEAGLEKVDDSYYKPTKDSGKPRLPGQNSDSTANVYYQVILPDGKRGYTKETTFKLDEGGRLVTSKGYPVDPAIYPKANGSIEVGADGTIKGSVKVGQLGIVNFANPAGLAKAGSNLYTTTDNSGAAQATTDFRLQRGALEASNVDLSEEMVNMMVANRAYELNSRSLKTSDEMLGMANQLLRR